LNEAFGRDGGLQCTVTAFGAPAGFWRIHLGVREIPGEEGLANTFLLDMWICGTSNLQWWDVKTGGYIYMLPGPIFVAHGLMPWP
jgi:hypothetical protein